MKTETARRSNRRLTPAGAGCALLIACLALAALTLLAPSAPSYDPFAWIVWGRELITPAATFSVSGGPSWKPLPVVFSAVFALAGGAAPALWLLVARAGGLLALAGAFRLGERLAGRWAGAIAAVAVLLLEDFVSLAWRGASEPLLLACVLWACERHLAGRRSAAFALGVAAALIRPEALPFLGIYAVVCWRGAGTRERLLLLGGLALVPLLWIGVPALGGDPLAASNTATNDAGGAAQVSAWTALRRGIELTLWPVWLLAAATLLLRRDDRRLQALLLGAVAWLALVVAMTAAGYSGVGRYMLPAAAVASVLASAAVVALWERWPRGRRGATVVAMTAVVVGAVTLVQGSFTLDDQVRDGVQVARARDDLRDAIAAAGGAGALRRCAYDGWVAINHTSQTALAWELEIPLDRAARTMSRPGIAIQAPRSAATGAPAPVSLPGAYASVLIARAGPWRVETVSSARASLPRACRLSRSSRTADPTG